MTRPAPSAVYRVFPAGEGTGGERVSVFAIQPEVRAAGVRVGVAARREDA